MVSLEVPSPALAAKNLLVRSHFSVISAGTEGKSVHDAKLGYLAKAPARKKEVNQVVESVKNNGLMTTYKIVSNKLDAPASLGCSCAGEVAAVGDEVHGFQPVQCFFPCHSSAKRWHYQI